MNDRTSPDTEKSAFIAAYPHLSMDEVPDAWGRPIFNHTHVQALWDGWFARACLDDRRPGVAQTPGLWRPIETAPKDGTRVLVQLKDPLPVEGRDDLERWHGVPFVARHYGVITDSGFDIGWQFAAPVGQGGFPDAWMVGWMPLPKGPDTSTDRTSSSPEVPVDAIVNLTNHQEQCDMDGVMVKVSRQALCEVLLYVTEVRPDNKWASPVSSPDRILK